MQLRQYQKDGINFLRSKKYALLADDPGLGKTAQAISAVEWRRETKVLVICPAQVKYHWQAQFKLWADRGAHVTSYLKEELPHSRDVYIINYDLINKKDKRLFNQLKNMRFTHLICDESHRLKNVRAMRTRRVLHKKGLRGNCERIWFLTGTPIKNRPIDLFSMLSACVPKVLKPYDSYLNYAYRYCGAYMGPFGLQTTGSSREDELSKRLNSFMLRREKQDVLDELPPRNVQTIELECSAFVKKLIKDEEENTVERAGSDDPHIFKLGEQARLRQLVALHKIDQGAKFINDCLEETKKVVVFFHHHKVKKELIQKLPKHNPITIDGGDSAAMRALKVKEFVEGEERILLGQIQAIGEGTDGLQHAASTCIFIEPSWSATDLEQCIGRLERVGQKDLVNAYILVLKDTIESQMMETVRWKEKTVEKILKQPKKEKLMHLEDRLEKVEEKLDNVISMVETFVECISYDLKDSSKIKKTKKEEPKAKEKEEPKVEEKVEEVAEVVSENEVRDRKSVV